MNNQINTSSWIKWANDTIWHFYWTLNAANEKMIAECGHSALISASQRSKDLPGILSKGVCPPGVCQSCYDLVKLKSLPNPTPPITSSDKTAPWGRSQGMHPNWPYVEKATFAIEHNDAYDPLEGEKVSDYSAEWRDDG